jgi:hypothetical protein
VTEGEGKDRAREMPRVRVRVRVRIRVRGRARERLRVRVRLRVWARTEFGSQVLKFGLGWVPISESYLRVKFNGRDGDQSTRTQPHSDSSSSQKECRRVSG